MPFWNRAILIFGGGAKELFGLFKLSNERSVEETGIGEGLSLSEAVVTDLDKCLYEDDDDEDDE